MGPLIDAHLRRIEYLRVSVTDRCNLRCIYCMPHDRRPIQFREILSYEEIVRVVRVAADLGITMVRLTGGEPLMRRNIVHLVQELASIEGIKDLSLTTNGVLLNDMAHQLKEAGLKRVNVSLDSLAPERYRQITRGGDLERVLQGINTALELGLSPVKLNVVVVKGLNDDEVVEFARLSQDKDIHIRFIEFMPGRHNDWDYQRVVPMNQIKETLEKVFDIQPIEINTPGPARHWRIKGARGVLGFISPITEHFCNECNRLRLTSDGRLRPCLFSQEEIDLKDILRTGGSDEDLRNLLIKAIMHKPQAHQATAGQKISRPMSEIGG